VNKDWPEAVILVSYWTKAKKVLPSPVRSTKDVTRCRMWHILELAKNYACHLAFLVPHVVHVCRGVHILSRPQRQSLNTDAMLSFVPAGFNSPHFRCP
jgi:hypothetical protein